jgi:hypothetical protein
VRVVSRCPVALYCGTNSRSKAVRPLPLTVIPIGNPTAGWSARLVVWPPECVTSGRTKPICPPRVGPFFACACGALLPCAWACGALLSCACTCGALISCACTCGALLFCAGGCGALISCAWASGVLPARVVASTANIIDALLILPNPPIFEVVFGFCNLLLVRLMPPVKRIKMSVDFPLLLVWLQERHTSRGWEKPKRRTNYANANGCPGRQPVRQLPFVLAVDPLLEADEHLHARLDSAP